MQKDKQSTTTHSGVITFDRACDQSLGAFGPGELVSVFGNSPFGQMAMIRSTAYIAALGGVEVLHVTVRPSALDAATCYRDLDSLFGVDRPAGAAGSVRGRDLLGATTWAEVAAVIRAEARGSRLGMIVVDDLFRLADATDREWEIIAGEARSLCREIGACMITPIFSADHAGAPESAAVAETWSVWRLGSEPHFYVHSSCSDQARSEAANDQAQPSDAPELEF